MINREEFAVQRAEAREHIARYLQAKRAGGSLQFPDYPGITDFGRMFHTINATIERRSAKDCIWRARHAARGETIPRYEGP